MLSPFDWIPIRSELSAYSPRAACRGAGKSLLIGRTPKSKKLSPHVGRRALRTILMIWQGSGGTRLDDPSIRSTELSARKPSRCDHGEGNGYRITARENFRRLRRQIFRTAASVDCFFRLDIHRHAPWGHRPRIVSLGSEGHGVRILLTGHVHDVAGCMRARETRAVHRRAFFAPGVRSSLHRAESV
jgi:hypothetical protein